VAIVRRLGVAVAMVLFVATVVYLDRDGYVDDADRPVNFVAAVYYATVTVTTTGYGDVTPVTDRSRVLTALLVTPARVVFLILLVGTTLELLTERWREAVRVQNWRRTLRDHYIICGFGVKGRSAIRTLLGQGVDRSDIVVVEQDRSSVEEAIQAGFAAVPGDASRTSVLEEAGVRAAVGVVIAPDRDDAAVLMTLTARELNPAATIVSAVREEENAHLLRQSGADSVITSSEASGRLLGMATRNPQVAEVLEDLLTAGVGLDVYERPARAEEVGKEPHARPGELIMAVIRGDEILRFDDPGARALEPYDRIVGVCHRPPAAPG
jgi:voltage-gated potassium channel